MLIDSVNNGGKIFRGWMFSHLEGELLTLVEALGLQQRQEDALKSEIRKKIWTYNGWEAGIDIPQDKDDEVLKVLGISNTFTEVPSKRSRQR